MKYNIITSDNENIDEYDEDELNLLNEPNEPNKSNEPFWTDDDEDDRQRIRFEPIYDADSSIYFSLGAKRQDKSDAKSCYVLIFVPIIR